MPSIIITLATALAITLLASGMTLLSGWQAFAPVDLALLGVAAAFLASGYFLLVQCMRSGEVSLTAPSATPRFSWPCCWARRMQRDPQRVGLARHRAAHRIGPLHAVQRAGPGPPFGAGCSAGMRVRRR
jgi:hypothetical protein